MRPIEDADTSFGNNQNSTPSAKPPYSDPYLLNTIINTIPDGISVHDANFNILIVNLAMEQLFPDKLPLEGKKCYFAYFELGEPCPDCPCKRAVYTGTYQSARAQLTLASVGLIWLETHAYPLIDANNNVTGVITRHQNLTEHMQLEYGKSQADLYLDLMSHDIKNLNQIALANLELVQTDIEEEKLKNRVATVLDVLNSITGLIKNVNRLRRVEYEEVKLKPVDISQVLDQVVERYTLIPGKNITIQYRPVLHSVTLADGLLCDVFSNLMDNAIKHSIGDHTEINVIMSAVKKDKKWYNRISIEDNGKGIPDEYKRCIFIRSVTLDKTLKGKGLGLYLVKMLVDKYQGEVWVEDRVPGDYTKGAKFVVMLPASE